MTRSPRAGRFRAPLLLAALPLMALAAHPTPVVVLVKQATVLQKTLHADELFVRTVKLGSQDVQRIKQEAHFTPEDPDVRFYLGKSESGEVTGVVLFSVENTTHGPVEVGLTFSPDGRVERAIVTKATVETKPWVLQAIRAGLMKQYEGMRYGDDPATALQAMKRADLGHMPEYMAGVISGAVGRGLALHHLLYRESSGS